MNYYYGRRYYSRRYPRRFSRRTYSSSSRSKRRAIGNYRAALQQTDSTNVNLSITHRFEVTNTTKEIGLNTIPVGLYAINIYDLLRKSTFYQSYANMYDQIKITSIRVKLTPLLMTTSSAENVEARNLVQSYSIVTAWDRTGLSTEDIYESVAEYNHTAPIIGTDNIEQNQYGKTDGIYVILTADRAATYSSAVTKSMNPNSSCTIVRALYPNTMAEKSQFINTADMDEWYGNIEPGINRFYNIRNPRAVSGWQEGEFSNTNNVNVTLEEPPLSAEVSNAITRNPCYLLESPLLQFKPTLLVGCLNQEITIGTGNDSFTVTPLVKFNLEADVGVTFRGLRKAPVVA